MQQKRFELLLIVAALFFLLFVKNFPDILIVVAIAFLWLANN